MTGSAPWWRDAVGYEVYVRSFRDTDGDGVGDLAGVRERLEHLVALGVDVVWLTPFYPSPQADHGYDVADYRGVDERFGSLADLDGLVGAAHRRGLRVLVDLVPNHTSDRHPWFRSACRSRDAEHRDYYVWRDPAPDGGPPNNWVSHFGGPAWSFHEPTGQYYLHLFLPEQPDLNWANEAVRDEFDAILEFWLGRGVDGVRIDVAHSLVIHPELPDNPLLDGADPDAAHPKEAFDAYEHRHDLDQPGVVDIYRRWRRIADRHDALLLGEVYLLDPGEVGRYVADDALHLAFCFSALRVGWDAAEVRGVLRAATAAGGGRFAWPLSSHDDPRAATRFGGGEGGRRRALAYLTLLSALPGVVFLHQGDELGLEDGAVPPDRVADPVAVRHPGVAGRDGSRTPMPWKPGPGLGFTTGRPWLPLGANRTAADTVAAQRGREGSYLERVRGLLAVRREHVRGRPHRVEWIGGGPLVAFRRGRVVAACNLGDDPVRLPAGADARAVYASVDDAGPDRADGAVTVPPEAAVIAVTDGA